MRNVPALSSAALKITCMLTMLAGMHCATDRASQLRSQRPWTVGFLGVAGRPSEDVAVVASANLPQSRTVYVEPDRRHTSTTKPEVDAIAAEGQWWYALAGAHWYPWKTSAFFLGLSADQYWANWTFKEDRVGSTGEKATVRAEWTGTTIGLPIGFDWIWENGFSLFYDVGPRYYIGGERVSYQDDGSDEGVDPAKRDATIDALSRHERVRFRLGGTLIVGYSF